MQKNLNMNYWDEYLYQKITEVRNLNGSITVIFGNLDILDISKKVLYHGNNDLDWDNMFFNSFELIIPSFDKEEVVIPWDKIRVITDPKFSHYLASKAEERADSIGEKL